MKHTLLITRFILLSFVLTLYNFSNGICQTTYTESENPDNLPVGIFYQSGPGSNNSTYNWTYPYGTKLSVNISRHRNFEITTTKYPNGELMFRQYDPANSQWGLWAPILTSTNGTTGIGTGNPQANIHILKSRATIFIENSNNSDWSFLRFKGPGSNFWDIGQFGDYEFLEFRPVGGSSGRMLLYQDGTLKTSNKIEITASGDGKELLRFSAERPWAFIQEGTSTGTSLVLRDFSGGKKFKIKGYNNEEAFSVQATTGDGYFAGKLGIGTNTPDAQLTVAGNIHAREVKVTIDAGADYVFEEDYEPISLDELQAFLKKNKHLPEVPSAAEMEEDGIELSKMNILLLKKVEELTLYLLEQEEKLNAQQDQINELKKLVYK